MAHLCIICSEFLTGESSQSSSSKRDPAPKALSCGHVFHQHCIRDWFDGTGGRNQAPGHGSCPKCWCSSSLDDALRIFPEVESTGGVEAYEKVKAEKEKLMGELRKTKEKLKEESTKKKELTGQLNRKNRLLNELVAGKDSLLKNLNRATAQLAECSSNHELLQLKHAEALSTVDSLTNDLQEKKDIIQAMEESAKAGETKCLRTGGPFQFTVRDKEILKGFVSIVSSKETKTHRRTRTHVATCTSITDTFINSNKYKEMLYNRDTEPTRSTLLRLVSSICKEISIKNRSPSILVI